MSNDDRLRLKESFSSYLSKAKALYTHLEEDWEQIKHYFPLPRFKEEFGSAIEAADEAFSNHNYRRYAESSARKERRILMDDARELYSELRRTLFFINPQRKFNMENLQEQLPVAPDFLTLWMGLRILHNIFSDMFNRPAYITDEKVQHALELHENVTLKRHTVSEDLRSQVRLREKRDEAFRTLRDMVRIVKETGRFVFRTDPLMKKRYK